MYTAILMVLLLLVYGLSLFFAELVSLGMYGLVLHSNKLCFRPVVTLGLDFLS